MASRGATLALSDPECVIQRCLMRAYSCSWCIWGGRGFAFAPWCSCFEMPSGAVWTSHAMDSRCTSPPSPEQAHTAHVMAVVFGHRVSNSGVKPGEAVDPSLLQTWFQRCLAWESWVVSREMSEIRGGGWGGGLGLQGKVLCRMQR